MIKKLYYAIAGDPNEKILKRYRPIVTEINAIEKEFEAKSVDELRAMTAEFKQRIQEATQALREELAKAQEEYMAVLGTDEQVSSYGPPASHHLRWLATANCLLDIGEDVVELAAGSPVPVWDLS